ncbi:MAG: antibiotic biosynthesis monooxygenase [Bacteroidota bacterium]
MVTCVYVFVKPENIDDFIKETRLNHLESVQEPGNLRFDILQDETDSSKFLLYEAYENAEAASRHKSTPHYLAWREKVAPWMAKPRKGIKYKLLFPENR